MVRICRAEDGEVFPTNATIHDIEGSGSLEAFLRKEIGIEEDAALAYLSDGRRLRTDNVSNLAEVNDQTIFVFNKYYLARDPDEVAKLLHFQPPLQPPIEESQTTTPSRKPPELGAAFHQAAQTHLQSISRIVDSMRHQRSALQLASNVVDSHVLSVSDVVTGARQELDKRAALVAGVDEAMDLASRVQIHREFMSPVVQRAMDAGGPPRTLGDYVSSERIRRAVDEFRDLQERFSNIEAIVKQFVDGATEGRSICADVRLLDTAVVIELSSQSLHGGIAVVLSALDAPVVNVEAILQELRSLDASIRDNLSFAVRSKNAYTSQCLRALRQIHTLNASLVSLPDDFALLQASLNTKGSFSDIERLHNIVYAYSATMVEVVRRKEFSSLFHRKCQGFSEVMSTLSAAETERRQAFSDEILGQLPFDLVGMDETLPSVEISVSGGERTNNHSTLERHDISNLLRRLKDSQLARNDSEAVPVRVQEVCTNLEGLVSKIHDIESGFTNLVERSLLSPPKQATSGVPRLAQNSSHSGEKSSGNELSDKGINASEPEAIYLGEQRQTTVNDHERVAQLERELSLARAQLESETAVRHALEDRLGAVRSILDQGRSERQPLRGDELRDHRHAFFLSLLAKMPHTVQSQSQSPQAHGTDSAKPLVVQLLEVAAAYRRTSVKALAMAQAQTAVPLSSARNNSEVEEGPGPSERQQPPPTELDLSDPARAIEVLRSFDHDGFLEAITKTGSTIRKWQKQCKGYRERAKDRISFRNFAKGDLALFLPTRNSKLRPWAAFNVSFPHYFLQPTGSLVEQLKTREWLVARITSILERVVEPNDPESNPYELRDGVKYYMLQVEEWNLRPSQRARPGAAPAAAVADAGEDAEE